MNINCRNISPQKRVKCPFEQLFIQAVSFCMFCEFHTYFPWITLKMRIITSGGLCCFSWSCTIPLLELHLSVLLWSSVAPRGDIRSACCCSCALLNAGSPVAQPPSEMLHFCTCFQDDWHLKGWLWLLTVCPWPALLKLENCLVQPVAVSLFFAKALNKLTVPSWQLIADVVEEQTMLAANCMGTFPFGPRNRMEKSYIPITIPTEDGFETYA